MRKRKWVLILTLVLIVTQAGGYLLWRVGRADDRIRQRVMEKMLPLLAEGSEIRTLRVGFGSVHVQGVRIVPKNRSFQLDIRDLRIGYSLWNLFRYRFNIQKVPNEIVLDHPVLLVFEKREEEGVKPHPQPWDEYGDKIEAFSTIRRVVVAEAEIRVENGSGRRFMLAQSLDGVLDTTPLDSALLRLSGNLFDSKKSNLEVSGRIDLLKGVPHALQIRLDEADPGSNLASIIPGYAEIRSGNLRAEALYSRTKGFTGFVELKDGDFMLKRAELRFRDTRLHGLFEGKGFRFSGLVGALNGSRVGLEGEVRDILDPELDIRVSCDRLDVRRFFNEINPSFVGLSSSKARFALRIQGRPVNPEVHGEIHADSLHGFGFTIDRFETKVALKDSVLELRGDAAQQGGLNLEATARVNLADAQHNSDIRLALSGDLRQSLPETVRGRFIRVDLDLELRASGKLSNPSGDVSAGISATDRSGRQTRLSAQMRLKDKLASVSGTSDDGFVVNGEIRRPFHTEAEWELRSSGFPRLLAMALNTDALFRSDSLKTDSRVWGSLEKWEATLTCSDLRRRGRRVSQKALEAELMVRRKERNRRQLALEARYYGASGESVPLTLQCQFLPQATLLQRCEIGNFVSATAERKRQPKGQTLSAEVRLQRLDVASLHAVFPWLSPYVGQYNARLSCQGGERISALRMDVSLRDGGFHGIGKVDGDLTVEWSQQALRYFSLSLQKDDLPYLVGSIKPAANDSLTGAVQSGTIVLEDLVQALTGKEDKRLVHGEAVFRAQAGGTALRPVLFARFEARDGAVGNVAYRDIQAALTDTLTGDRGFLDGTLRLDRGFFRRDDGLEAEFEGVIPHDGEKPRRFSLSANGNLLGFLPELGSAFQEAQGTGEARLRFSGLPGRFRMTEGSLKMDAARVRLSSIVDKIEKIRIDAVLEEGDSLLQVRRCTGQIRGGTFAITNRRAAVEPEGRDSFKWKTLGVEFGVLQISTDSRGIPIHIPGLMAPGEQGWIAFSGDRKTEPFVVAGPADSPLLEGTVNVHDNQLTYPFLPTEAEGSNPGGMNRFLNKLRWNLRIIPQKDVHYIRDMVSPFGNVYVDMKLQAGLDGMFINGRLKDDTFQVWGHLVSSEGTIEVLDRYFRPERIEFDYPRGGSPFFSGRAYTIISDSTGIPSTVWLNLVSIDKETGIEEKEGPWKRVQFRFSSDNPNLGRNEADLLAAIGYSVGNMKNRAYDAIGMHVENQLFRPILRPIEKGMRRYLGFDMVKFSSMFSRNLFEMQNSQVVAFDPKWLLRSSKVTLGRTFGPGLMLFYSGEVQNGFGYRFPMMGFGLRHSFALEYAIRPELLLEMEYTYDSQLLYERREDKRIWVRHVFPF
jgi:hypothetical protein